MNWSPEDVNALKHDVELTLSSIDTYQNELEMLKKVVQAFGQLCYSRGYERGYTNGQNDAKNGKDERIPYSSIRLN